MGGALRRVGPLALLLAGAVLALGAGLYGAPAGSVPGVGGVDHPGTIWTWWVLRDALAAADPGLLLHTPWFFHPYGQALYQNTGLNLLDALLGLLFAPLGPTAGHAAALLAVPALNGLGGWFAARRLGLGQPLWAAAALALAPFPLYELAEGRPTQALLLFPALYAAAWGGGARVEAGVLLALTGYGYWFYGLFALVATALWVLLGGGEGRGAELRRLVVAAGVAALLVAPVAAPLAWSAWVGTAPGLQGQGEAGQILLTSWQPRWFAVGVLGARDLVLTQRALPLTAVLVGLWALTRPGAPRVAALLGLVAVGLAVGPTWVGADGPHPEPVYGLLVELLPPLARLWHPSRWLVVPAVLLAFAAASLPRGGVLVVLGLAAEALADGLLPLPTWDAAPPAGYRCLAAGGGGEALVELPFPSTPTRLAWQPLHRRPILGGMWETEEAFLDPRVPTLRADPWLAALLARSRGLDAPAAGDPGPLGALGYGYVVLLRDELPAGEGAAPRRRRRAVEEGLAELLGEPLWGDARTTVWSPWGLALPCAADPPTPDAAPGTLAGQRAVRVLGRVEGWAPVEPARPPAE